MAKKYSSFKQQQMITENFRKFMNEEGDALGTGVITAEEQAIIDFIKKVEKGALEKNATVIVDIENLDDEAAKQVLKGEGIFDAVAADFIEAGVKNPDDRDIRNAIQNWINDRGLTSDGEIDYKKSYGMPRHSDKDVLTTGGITESKVRFTKRQLQKIIKEEIKKTLNEASKPKTKPEWMDEYDWETIQNMDQEKYNKFFAPIIAQRAKEDEESAAHGLAKAEELEQEFLNDPKIADLLKLGAEAEVRADGLWVRLPSENEPGTMSSNGPETSNRLHSKLIYSDWSATGDFDKKGWVRVVKRRKEKPLADPDPHGRYVPGEEAPRLSPWGE